MANVLDVDDFTGDVDDELLCSICQGVLRSPHSCKAGHTFCRECITTWLGRQRTCPVDRQPLTLGTPVEILRNTFLSALHCTTAGYGPDPHSC